MLTKKNIAKDIKALWFNPQNDLALAADKTNYTPPKAATQLANAGELLPMWLADESDMIITGGTNNNWLAELCSFFKVNVNLWNRNYTEAIPAPWGWSLYTRDTFIKLGFRAEICPDIEQLKIYRKLSGRGTVEHIDSILFPDTFKKRIISSVDQLEEILTLNDRLVVKTPWSCSGRGVSFYERNQYSRLVERVKSIIENFGYATVEPKLHNPFEFSLLYFYERGEAKFHGLSRTMSASAGKYAGNIVASYLEHRSTINNTAGNQELIDSLIPQAAHAIKLALGNDYRGPIGLDFLLSDSKLYLAEHNLRYTMGFVASGINAKTGYSGTLSISNSHDTLQPGEISLTQPGCDMRFILH